jgi:hypothetical protein
MSKDNSPTENTTNANRLSISALPAVRDEASGANMKR